MSKKAVVTPSKWNSNGNDLAFIGGFTGTSIPIATIIAASQGTPMKVDLSKKKSVSTVDLLGVCWDCAVTIREKMIFPAAPFHAEISAVSQALKEHLRDEFETFLRPSARLGLPPSQ